MKAITKGIRMRIVLTTVEWVEVVFVGGGYSCIEIGGCSWAKQSRVIWAIACLGQEDCDMSIEIMFWIDRCAEITQPIEH